MVPGVLHTLNVVDVLRGLLREYAEHALRCFRPVSGGSRTVTHLLKKGLQNREAVTEYRALSRPKVVKVDGYSGHLLRTFLRTCVFIAQEVPAREGVWQLYTSLSMLSS